MMTLNAGPSTPDAQSALYLIFKIETDFYALQAVKIEFVLSRQQLKHLPGAPAWMVGLFSLDDKVIPVIDIYQRLLGRPASMRASTRLVIARYDHDQWIGLLLEKVSNVEPLPVAAWMSATVTLAQHEFLGAVQQHPRLGLVQNIELELLLPMDVRQSLFPANPPAMPDTRVTTNSGDDHLV